MTNIHHKTQCYLITIFSTTLHIFKQIQSCSTTTLITNYHPTLQYNNSYIQHIAQRILKSIFIRVIVKSVLTGLHSNSYLAFWFIKGFLDGPVKYTLKIKLYFKI